MFFIRLALLAIGAISITILGCVWLFPGAFSFASMTPCLLEKQRDEGVENHPSELDDTPAEESALDKMIRTARKDGSTPLTVKCLTEALQQPDESVRAAAAWALGRIGQKSVFAVPELRIACADPEPEVSVTAEMAIDSITHKATGEAPANDSADRFLARIPYSKWNFSSNTARANAERIFTPYGRWKLSPRTARATAEQHFTFLQTPTADKKDPEIVVKALTKALKDPDASVRKEAVQSLGRMGDKAVAAVPALTEALEDKDTDVRGAAATALGRMGKKAKAAASGLAALLSDNDRDVRSAGALALLRIGKDASEAAVPSLLKMAKSEDKFIQVYASAALVILDEKSEPHIRVLADALTDPTVLVRGSAAYVLGELGPVAKSAVPALARALVKDEDKLVREAVARALGEMGSESKIVVPALIEALRDPDKGVRSAVAMAIGEVGPAAKEAVPALIDSLKDKEFEVRGSACFALGEIGPAANAALNTLAALLTRDENAEVRRAATVAVGKIGEE